MIVNSYTDMENLQVPKKCKDVECGLGKDTLIRVSQYLPIRDKIDLINYVVDNAIDETTGCFSPVRVNVYYSIGILRQYCGISFAEMDEEGIANAYDKLESSGVIDTVEAAIPEEELKYMNDLLMDTIKDISRYNNSAAGIIHSMSGDANGLSDSLQDILSKVKNREGIELLGEIKNVVGND